MNHENARQIAVDAISSIDNQREWALFEDLTKEHAFGWVFRYGSKLHVETGDRRYEVPGCGPVIVDRLTGEAVFLPTFRPSDLLIAEYEKTWLSKSR